MYKRLTVSHFKSLESVDIKLGQINVFVGNNGSGKSNLIDALRFVRDAFNHGLDRAVSDRHGIESIRQWSPTRPYRVSIDLEYQTNKMSGKYGFSLDSRSGQYHVVREEGSLDVLNEFHFRDGNGEFKEAYELNKTEFARQADGYVDVVSHEFSVRSDGESDIRLDEAYARLGDPSSETQKIPTHADELFISARHTWNLYEFRDLLSHFQAYSIFPNTLRLPQEPSNETLLAPEGRNLASVFKRMRKTKIGQQAITQITDAMRSIVPNLERISILSVGGYLVPQFHVVEPNDRKHIFNVSQMSDGTLRVLGLLTALYQEPRPAAIALEEPEQTVNPAILTVIAESIREVSQRTQVFVTTHSPHFLDQFDPSDVVAVELRSGRTQVGRVSEVQIGAVKDRLFSLGELLVTEGLQHD